MVSAVLVIFFAILWMTFGVLCAADVISMTAFALFTSVYVVWIGSVWYQEKPTALVVFNIVGGVVVVLSLGVATWLLILYAYAKQL